MKKLFLILPILLCLSFSVRVVDAPIDCNAYSRRFIEAANTSSTEIQFCDIPRGQYRLIILKMKSTNSDSIAFSIGTAVTSANAKYGPGQKVIFTIRNGTNSTTGEGNLFYKADVADDEFTPTH